MKKIFTILLLISISICSVMAQTPQTDPHCIMNTKFSDEFNVNLL